MHGVNSTANMPHCGNGDNSNSNNRSDDDNDDYVNQEYMNSEQFVFDTLFEIIKGVDSNNDDEMFDSGDE